ncbi:hypothetical protein COD78_28355 [Bacillus cereus]|uniref:YveK family protein n=1 Tax=Bacillus cereus TaxID=1396 RepID=UPI000BF581BA|nr:Wzz/FepE/Etk N-terminal domain-containing protein [Bacillus cereus]PEX06317.1 hypothetical protein CN454_28830 [Bacillus cereus]PGV18307.1 hypothetical protein COD78_28355 [Bacillus cereus]
MNKITLNEFLKTCKQYLPVMILIPIVVTTMVYVVHKTILPPKYVAETQLIISTQKGNTEVQNFDNLRSSMQLVETFSSILQSSKVMEEVNSQLNIKKNLNTVTVIKDEKSLITNLKITGKDKKQVVEVANTVAIKSKEKFMQLFEGMKVEVLSNAEDSKQNSITPQLILGAFAGVISSFMLVFSILFFSTHITKEEHIKEMDNIVLGDVPLMKGRKGDE